MSTLIHIGYPKAGSTFLQKNVFPHLPVQQAMMPLVNRLVETQPFDPEPFLRQLKDQFGIDPTQQMILSEEFLSGRTDGNPMWDPEDIAERLHATFPEARILIIIREQVEYLLSLYAFRTMVRGAETRTLCDYLRDLSGQLTQKLQYHHLVERYQELFSPDRVHVLPYEQLVMEPEVFVDEIISFAGWPLQESVTFGRVNASMRNRTILGCHRMVNRIATPILQSIRRRRHLEGDAYIALMDRYFTRKEQRLTPLLTKLFPPGRNPITIDPNHPSFPPFQKAIQASNIRLRELTGLDLTRYGYSISP